MKKLLNHQIFQFNHIGYFMLTFLLISGGLAFGADEKDPGKGDMTIEGLTIEKSTMYTEKQIKEGVDWSKYTKYQIAPVEVSFRKDWKKDYCAL